MYKLMDDDMIRLMIFCCLFAVVQSANAITTTLDYEDKREAAVRADFAKSDAELRGEIAEEKARAEGVEAEIQKVTDHLESLGDGAALGLKSPLISYSYIQAEGDIEVPDVFIKSPTLRDKGNPKWNGESVAYWISSVRPVVSWYDYDKPVLEENVEIAHYLAVESLNKATAEEERAKERENEIEASVESGDDDTLVRANAYTSARVAECFPLSEGNSIWAYLTGENFRVTITNYDSKVHAPRVSYEYRMSTNEDWRVVWDENTGLLYCINVATNAAIEAAREMDSKPINRAWGKYNSETGEESPDGLVQVSSVGGLLIGSGVAYSKIDSSGHYWVLSSTGYQMDTQTNGTFRINSSDGDCAFEIRKGNIEDVEANVGDFFDNHDGTFSVRYRVKSNERPKLFYSPTLVGGGEWISEDDSNFVHEFTWSGESENWLVTVKMRDDKQVFFKSKFKKGGETVVEVKKPLKADRLVIGENTYKIGTANVNGTVVMTLTLEGGQ